MAEPTFENCALKGSEVLLKHFSQAASSAIGDAKKAIGAVSDTPFGNQDNLAVGDYLDQVEWIMQNEPGLFTTEEVKKLGLLHKKARDILTGLTNDYTAKLLQQGKQVYQRDKAKVSIKDIYSNLNGLAPTISTANRNNELKDILETFRKTIPFFSKVKQLDAKKVAARCRTMFRETRKRPPGFADFLEGFAQGMVSDSWRAVEELIDKERVYYLSGEPGNGKTTGVEDVGECLEGSCLQSLGAGYFKSP